MSDATCLSEPPSPLQPPAPSQDHGLAGVRVSGGVSIRVASRDGITRVVDVSERDGYKVRFPRRSVPPEAIIINTGGGLAGGDRIAQEFIVGPDASLTVTTQASERSYRALNAATTTLRVTASVAENATFSWLPQETILFDQTRLQRSIDVELAPSARLLLAETVVFGRTAMGETLATGLFTDQWRISRANRLIFAENVRLNDATFALMSTNPLVEGVDAANSKGAQAALNGHAKVAFTLLLAATDAEDFLPATRLALQAAPFQCAATAWDGKLIVRGLAGRSEDVRHVVARLVPVLGAGPVPRVWWT